MSPTPAPRIDWYVARSARSVTYEPIVMPDGKVGHVELAVGGAGWMMADEYRDRRRRGATTRPGQRGLAAPDRRRRRRARGRVVAAGTAIDRGPEDSPPAGRVAVFRDPFGHRWFLNGPISERR